MKTGIQRIDAANGGATASVEYDTFPNAMPASQEQAPRLGRAYTSGTADQAEVVKRMVEGGCQMGAAEIVRVLNATGFVLKSRLAQEARAFDLGFVRFLPVIGGTFATADADFDPSIHRLYVGARPSDDIRDCLSGATPTRIGGVASGEITNVTWDDGRGGWNTVKSGEPFEIYASYGMFVGAGDEYGVLSLPDGSTVDVALVPPAAGKALGQRIVGRPARTVDACEGAVLTVYTHGSADLSGDLEKHVSNKLMVLAADAPTPPGPAPELERGYSVGHGEGEDDGKVYPGTGFVLEGTNFAGASVKITYQIAGQPSDVDVDSEDMTVTDTSVTIDAASPALQEAIQATGTLTFTVTTSAGSDTYNAVVME